MEVILSRWVVKMTKIAESELKRMIKTGTFNNSDIHVLLKWVDEMEEFGPDHISHSSQWHDHALDRKWSGYRSSAFSKSGRIIYRIINKKIIVEVHRVTANHDYK